jgi:hypothetical protein
MALTPYNSWPALLTSTGALTFPRRTRKHHDGAYHGAYAPEQGRDFVEAIDKSRNAKPSPDSCNGQ